MDDDTPVILGYGSCHDLYRGELSRKQQRKLEKQLARRIPIGFHKPPKRPR